MDPFGVMALADVKIVDVETQEGDAMSKQATKTLLGNDGCSDEAYARLECDNHRMQQQIEDLTGALKARDMEITLLRERCEALAAAMEEQDEVFARVCTVVPPRVMAMVSREMQKKQPGLDNNKSSVPPVSTCSKKNDSHGFEDTSGTENPACKMGCVRDAEARTTVSRNGSAIDILSTAIDRIINPPSKKKDLRRAFAAVGNSATDESSTSTSECSSMRSLEFHGSLVGDEDIAKSAGFLRRRTRQSSGKLCVSDFGLLESTNHDDSPTKSQDTNVSNAGDEDDEDEHESSKKLNGARSLSQHDLFGDIDPPEQHDPTPGVCVKVNDTIGDTDTEMTYAEFLERLQLPSSRDLAETIRLFLCSILGPRGDGLPPRNPDFVEYDFYGSHEFRQRCTYFFQHVEEMLLTHPVWRHTSELTLSRARDGIEKYIMDKLGDIAMNQLDECNHWNDEDNRLMRRMKTLSFITPDMLDIKPWMRNEVAWSMAEDELRRINFFRAPGDKINCIVRCCSIIFSVLNLSRGENESRPGADDFLPVFIYIVLHSKIPRLYSNCEYIAAYRNPADLMSKAGYCFVNLRSAIEFILVVDASMLSITEDEFSRMYRKNEEALDR